MNKDQLEGRGAKCGVSSALNTEYRLLITLALLLSVIPALAFPPSPDHVISGIVRDELGNPISIEEAEVILTTSSGVKLETTVRPNLSPGVNYRLRVPIDSGLTADPYKPTALSPTVPFRLTVKVGAVTYLPIEMVGDFMNLGQPAGETHLDLTLGEDSDGDGLPDAWERALLKAGQDLSDINPNDDTDGDGMSNLNEYLAGTYAFDSSDGFTLGIRGMNEGRAVLEFTAIRGRSYAIQRSSDLQTWESVAFRVPAEGAQAPARTLYQATDVRTLRVEAEPGSNDGEAGFFKLILQ